ncbi:tetratricopeptide repeat protein [Neolewinella agarilytica]|uniref:Tetratricopeptide repeat-containing protein n=1 Tax=Neolewinella agarilytica TaxID=478744 RepID=A0A1H9KC05_9BACT|nr:transcriptional regulator [Neolewinella agarilytica]SEQ96726.1 hypothetical protein SAMN05444359_12043 [Neolewinella agarilytica]
MIGDELQISTIKPTKPAHEGGTNRGTTLFKTGKRSGDTGTSSQKPFLSNFNPPTLHSTRSLIFSLLFLYSLSLTGQANFRAGYERENPVPQDSILPTEQRLSAHLKWLSTVENKEDTLLRIFGEIYVFYDYVRMQDYTTATEHLLIAESLANTSQNEGWKGGVAYRRGHLWVILRETDEAIGAYENAARWCEAAGDSLCMAESLEQLSAMHALKDSFEIARNYFYRALPLLEKYGAKKNLQTAHANFGNLLLQEGSYHEAIPYLTIAKDLAQELHLKRPFGKAINNLSHAYSLIGKTDMAINGFQQAIRFNEENGFTENIVQNYAGLRELYENQTNYKLAYEYQDKFRYLRDSLIGSKTKLQIARLEENFRMAEKQLKLEASEKDLLTSQRRAERFGVAIFLLLMVSAATWWFWQRRLRESRAKIEEGKQNLKTLTRLLSEKNAALVKLNKTYKTSTFPSAEESHKAEEPKYSAPENNVYSYNLDNTILTSADWEDFKAQFNRAHPGYLQRLRMQFPHLTEAEERLFLLIKLSLNTNEIANILGISSGGVKKTRNRLRKKLPLQAEDSLENFVRSFSKRIHA